MKNEKIKLLINDIGTNGEGVANKDGVTYFVPFCLPKEEVEATVTFKKGNVAQAKLEKIVKSVNGRCQAACKNFTLCGGCQLQHMNYCAQVSFKREKVKKNLKKIGGINFDVNECVPSDKSFGYRNKLQIPVRKIGSKAVCGFFQSGSHKLVPVTHCPLQDEWADKVLKCVVNFVNENDIAVYDEVKKTGLVRHVVARHVENQLLLTVVINGDELTLWQKLKQKLDENFDRYGLFVNINKKHDNVILGNKTLHLCGLKHIQGDCLGVKFCLQPDSFFQINDFIRDKIYADAISLLDTSDCDIIVDAFSGVGILSGVLCKSGKQVFGIEIVKAAVEDADNLKKINNLKNLTNICGDVNVELKNLCEKNSGKKIALVVDPPRKGLGQPTIEAILHAKPQNIVYISCDSATLSRDVKALSKVYEIKHCTPYDMFPQTDNVETLVVLKKINE